MNPACRLNLESKECQEWMNEVCAHCAHLLPGVEEAELWDRWWADELPAAFKPRVDLMSAYDCHKLRREVAHQVTTRGDEEWHADEDNPVTWTICQLILLIIVMVFALIAMVLVLKILCAALRRWPGSMKCAPANQKKKPEEKPPPPPPPVDVETPPQKDSCRPAKLPKAFISFGRTTDPRTRFGPYKHQKLLQTAPLPECQPAEY